jgi:glycine/D-amino acid oxidase-like deaminating enzyme
MPASAPTHRRISSIQSAAMNRRALVLGAGLQGASVALALLDEGWSVAIFDQADDCLRRASLRNEGKVHLGFLFANDHTLRTTDLMQQGALAFGALIEGWLREPVPWHEFTTAPFCYCLGRTSMLSADDLLTHYAAVEARFLERLREPGANYLGRRPTRLWRPMDRAADLPRLSRTYAEPLVQSVEVALDRTGFTNWFRERFRGRAGLTEHYGHRVEGVTRTSCGFRAHGCRRDDTAWHTDGDIVVNCLWEGRLAVDRTMGVAPKRDWVYRLKYRVFVRLPPDLEGLPPMTFVIGPYGDIVPFPSGTTYLSYYPICIQGWTSDLEPPRAWEAPCDGQPDPEFAMDLARRLVTRLDDAIPGLGASSIVHVDAGAIFTWGRTDIDDPASELHNRFDVGVEAYDGYFSIDTGKFTTAPLFADRLARLV